MKNNKTLILYVSHLRNEYTIYNYNRLVNEVDNTKFDVLFYEPDWNYLLNKYSDIAFNEQVAPDWHFDLKTISYVGNTILILFDILEKYPEYNYYYYMEFDCYYTGHYGEMFNTLDNILYKININYLFQSTPQHFKHWWWTDKPYNVYDLTEDEMTIKELYNEYSTGNWYGHHELLIPSILSKSDLKPDYINRYIKIDMRIYEHEVPELLHNNTLYHPIKNLRRYTVEQ